MYSEKIYKKISKFIKNDSEIKKNFSKYILITLRPNKDRFKRVSEKKYF